MRRTLTKNLVPLVSIILVVLLAIRSCNQQPENVKIITEYKTDTLYVPEPYKVWDTLEIISPPRYITVYKTDTIWREYSLECNDDSIKLINDSLSHEINIHKSFLTQFPDAPKLVDLNLTLDSLKLTTLNNQGRVANFSYPIFLDQLAYQYVGGTLRNEPIDNKSSSSILRSKDLYGNIGYQFLLKKPLVGLEYNVKTKSLLFSLEAASTIETQPILSLTGKVGYKLNN